MKILRYPHPSLFRKTELLEPDQVTDLEEKIREMFNLMYAYRGVGLAAPQVGWNVRLAIINPRPPKRKSELVLVNPQIIGREGRLFSSEEGCLSLPGKYDFIERYPSISVKYCNPNFEYYNTQFNDRNIARIVQHEIDHLDGVCLIYKRLLNKD